MQRLSHLALNDEGFVFDPTTGDSFQVSQTGLAILGALRDGKGDDEIAQSLVKKYEVTLEDAKRDVADFRGQLKTVGLA
ncbi:MAG: PqqD family protein [Verrucomicrobia bacterium]|nr:PqqD family protein [Verrucomicrobiota bacterium]